jgi:glycosyltransferase involved in cell wall biosynthesis
MNILFITLVNLDNMKNQGIYQDLIKEFIRNGHNMYVVNPLEKKIGFETYLLEVDKLSILNVKIGNVTKTNVVEKGISMITLQKKFKKSIDKNFKNIKFDLIIYSTPPITFARVIKYLKKKYNCKTYLMLKDIFPQNAVDIRLMNKYSPLYFYFRLKEISLYKISDFIGCMSDANIKYILQNNKFVNKNKIEICPNSINPSSFSDDYQIKTKTRIEYNLPLDKNIFIYGGNIGKPQGINFIIKCIKANEDNLNSFILVVGFGTEYSKLKYFFDSEKPLNSKLIKHVEKEKYELLVNACDVGLIFLDNRFTIPNFPSRILSYMQSSLPILASTDKNTDLGSIIVENNFGLWSQSNCSETFNKNLVKLCNDEIRKTMGMNSYNYLLKNYTVKNSYNTIIKHFID